MPMSNRQRRLPRSGSLATSAMWSAVQSSRYLSPGQHLDHFLAQGLDQVDIERMARTASDEVSAYVVAQKKQVAEYIEDLVACRLVGEAEVIIDRPARAKDQQVPVLGAWPQALLFQLQRLAFQEKSAATGDFGSEGLRRDVARVDLRMDWRRLSIVEKVTDPQFKKARGVQGQRGITLTNHDGPVNAVYVSVLFLHNGADGLKSSHETLRGTVQTRRFRRVEVNIAVIDVQSAQGGQNVLNQADLEEAIAKRGAAMCTGHIIDMGADASLRAQIEAHKYHAGAHRGRSKA
jgi:hypothetical protein